MSPVLLTANSIGVSHLESYLYILWKHYFKKLQVKSVLCYAVSVVSKQLRMTASFKKNHLQNVAINVDMILNIGHVCGCFTIRESFMFNVTCNVC